MFGMDGTKSFWDQNFDWLSDQFVTRVAEQTLCLCVRSQNQSGVVRDEYGIGRRVE
jgi:hypothetical protein